MVRLEEGLKQLTDVTNFHIYASHQINVAQAAVFRLQLGLGVAEANVDKIFEYLRVMTTHRASPAVIPPIALRELLRKVRAKMKPNPHLRLPYDPDTEDIWKYYKVIKNYPCSDRQAAGYPPDHPNYRQHIRTEHISRPQPSSYTPRAQNSHQISSGRGILRNWETWGVCSIAQ